MARISAFRQQIDIAKSQLQGPARQQFLAAAARQALRSALDHDSAILGHEPPYQTIVDGRQGAAEETVRPGGAIIYLFAVGAATLEQAVDELYRLLLEMSPVKTGRYRDSHRLLINGAERDAALEGASIGLKDDDVVSFVNLQPYARKIERGYSAMAPNGVYEAALATLRARYGNILRLGFAYDRYPGFAIGPARRGGKISSRADLSRAERYPTITLQVK